MPTAEVQGATEVAAVDARTETRVRIQQAALSVFATHGFDGSTTRDIAQRAGVNLGLLQYHFGGKDKIWRAAVELAFSRLHAGLDATLADPSVDDDVDRARLLVRGFVRFVAANPEFVLLMNDVGKRPGPRMEWLADTHVRPLFNAIEVLFKRTGGRLRLPEGVSPMHLHYVLAGAAGLIFHQAPECKHLSGIDPFDEVVVEDHARVVEFLIFGPPEQEISP